MNNNNYRLGMALVAVGIVFLFLRMTGFSMMSLAWPLFVLVPGAAMLYGAFRGEKAELGLAIPGAVIGGTGAILFFLNLTGRWEAWAYMWTLYPVFTGGALYYVGQHNANESLSGRGMTTVRSGLWMLVGFGLFFEVLIFESIFSSVFLPVVLVAVGLYLMAARDRVKFGFLPDGKAKGKPKRELDPETGISPELRRQMDEALTEDDRTTV